jgi:hypothetical protein
MQHEKIRFNIRIINPSKATTSIYAYTLKELNQILNELETNFLGGIEESIFIKEITKDEFIFYKNELGIKVKGIFKNYQIQSE